LKLLLVDTNIASMPIFMDAKEIGAEVHVIGNNSKDVLCNIADKYWQKDYSKVDVLEELILREGFDYVVPGSNDQSYLSCMSLSDAHIRPGYESLKNTLTLNEKSQFRELCGRIDLSAPIKYDFSKNDFFEAPLIVKPVDAYSGKGITLIEESDSALLDKAIKLAKDHSHCNNFVIEQYLDGQLYSHSAFIEGGNIIKDFFVKEDCITYPFAVDTSCCLRRASVGEFPGLTSDIELLIKELNLNDGLLHTQFIVSNGRHYIIEVTRRCPGDLYSHLIQLSTGDKYAKAYLYGFLGMNFDWGEGRSLKNILRHSLTTEERGVFSSVDFYNLEKKFELFSLVKAGTLCDSLSYSRLGIIFIELDSEIESNMLYQAFIERKVYKVKLL